MHRVNTDRTVYSAVLRVRSVISLEPDVIIRYLINKRKCRVSNVSCSLPTRSKPNSNGEEKATHINGQTTGGSYNVIFLPVPLVVGNTISSLLHHDNRGRGGEEWSKGIKCLNELHISVCILLTTAVILFTTQ